MSRWWMILMAAASLAVGSTVSAQASTCDTTIDNGLHAQLSMTSKDYASAYDQFRCASDQYPLDTALYVGLGESAVLSGHYTESWAPYNLLTTYYPDMLQTRADELSTLLAQNQSDVDLLLLQANTMILQGYRSDADSSIDTVLALEPNNVYAILLKAESLAYNGDNAGFREYATKARYLSDDAYTRAYLANDYDSYLGETDTAVDLISRAIAEVPDNAEFHALYAYFLNSRLGNTKAGAAEYRQAISLNASNVNVLISAAATLSEAGDSETANLALSRLDSLLPPGSRDLYVTRAYVADAAKDPQAAAEQIDAYGQFSYDKITDAGPLQPDFTSTESMYYDHLIKYSLDLQAGESVIIQANSLDGSVDTLLAVVDSLGNGVAFSDDYDATENYNAQVTVTADEDETYTVWVTHAGAGSYGDVDTTVTVESGAPLEPDASTDPFATEESPATPDLIVTAEAAI